MAISDRKAKATRDDGPSLIRKGASPTLCCTRRVFFIFYVCLLRAESDSEKESGFWGRFPHAHERRRRKGAALEADFLMRMKGAEERERLLGPIFSESEAGEANEPRQFIYDK